MERNDSPQEMERSVYSPLIPGIAVLSNLPDICLFLVRSMYGAKMPKHGP